MDFVPSLYSRGGTEHNRRMSTATWSDEQLNQLRQRADPAVDALVRQLFEHAGPGRADFGRLGYNHIIYSQIKSAL